MSAAADVLIIGAGIVGAACARACAEAGLTVRVLDRGPIGGGTTAAGMGHLVVMDDSEAQFALTAYSRRLWHEERDRLPADVEFDECGTLWVAADADEFAEVERKADYYTTRGVAVEIVDDAALARLEPNLRPGMRGALRVPHDAVIYPPCAAAYLLNQAARTGRLTLERADVAALDQPHGTVRLRDGGTRSAGNVVNAAGPWSTQLDAGLPVKKRKGHLVITDRYPGFANHQIVELGYLKSAHAVQSDSVAFNIQPRKTGQMLIGSSRQYEADGLAIEPLLLGRMLARAREYMPGITELSALRAWTGHRAATPDKLPLIGPSVEHPRYWLATGHEGLGITTSLGTAALLVDQMLERPSAIPGEPYRPARFSQTVREPAHA